MASFGEFITFFLSSLKMPIDEDIASNLLLGIERVTNNFSLTKSTPMTFEAVALCLRAGGRKPRQEFAAPSEALAKEGREKKVEKVKQVEVSKVKPSPDWFKPKIYKGNTKI
jgi:nanoRNase/pAp phosphatase (c-di-AMP/oligoRNAs hydrolase)